MAIPITQKAGTIYGSAPKNQEVTIDARGTQVANFERMSPVKMADQSLIAGASAMGMGNVRENLAPVDLSYLTSAFEDNLSEEEKNKLAHERSNKYYNRQAKKKARQDARAARKNK
jgi:hypothetical protein